MTKQSNIVKKIVPTFISLSLAICLILSSLSAYSTELFFNDTTNQTSFSQTQLEQECIYYTPIPKHEFIAEIIDAEEEEEDVYPKKNIVHADFILRTLWSYSYAETENDSKIKCTEHPILLIHEPHYIEYCSLKIPS